MLFLLSLAIFLIGVLAWMLSWNHAYANSWGIGENKRILNIRQHSRAFLHKLTSNRKNWLSHRVFANIRLFHKFGCGRMYSVHNDEYRECTNTLIRTLFVRLFSVNVVGYSPRINVCVVPPLCYCFYLPPPKILFINCTFKRSIESARKGYHYKTGNSNMKYHIVCSTSLYILIIFRYFS